MPRIPSRARSGLTIALLGPEGVGKSTVAAALLRADRRARLVKLRVDGTGGAGSSRRRRRLIRVWRALAAGGTVRMARARGRTVIWDRHPYEHEAIASLGRSAMRGRRAVLRRWIPDPDLVIVLDLPAETLQPRQPEHSLAELEALRAGYRELASRSLLAHLVDASAPPDVVVGRVQELIARYCEGTLASLRSDPLAQTLYDAGPTRR